MRAVSISKAIPIRFSDEMLREMDIVSGKMGLSSASGLAKVAVAGLLRYFEKYPEEAYGTDFKRVAKFLLAQADHRTNLSKEQSDPPALAADPHTTYEVKPPRKPRPRKPKAGQP
jgi:hypothetical protein